VTRVQNGILECRANRVIKGSGVGVDLRVAFCSEESCSCLAGDEAAARLTGRKALICGQLKAGLVEVRRPSGRGCPKNDAHIDYPAGWVGKMDGELLWAASHNGDSGCSSVSIPFGTAEQGFAGIAAGSGGLDPAGVFF
jgi:hypothetical protein